MTISAVNEFVCFKYLVSSKVVKSVSEIIISIPEGKFKLIQSSLPE